MEKAHAYSSDIAFTPSVKAVQARKGSRQAYRRKEERGSWQTEITPELAAFIEAQTSIFLATVSAEGQPYIQHRGGPAGFLRVIDNKTIGFVDFVGNRQYITQGNLSDNPKAHLFLIDYAHRRRVKIWGEARVVEGDAKLTTKLMAGGYTARPEQVILFSVSAWDANCPQHIPQRFEAADVAAAMAARDKRIEALEAEIKHLREVTREISSYIRAIFRSASAWRPRRAEDIVELIEYGTVRTSLIIDFQKQDVRERILQGLVSAFRPYARDASLEVPCLSIMATGVKRS